MAVSEGKNGKGRFWIPNWMVDHGYIGKLNQSEVKVCLALTRFANKEGETWPGVKKIADMMKLSQRTVKRSLAGLRKKGMIMPIDNPCGRGHIKKYKLFSQTWFEYHKGE